MQPRLATKPNSGTNVCLMVLKVWCSRNATIATMQVSIYSRKVPKLLTSVTMSRLLGILPAVTELNVPSLYQKLAFCESLRFVSSEAVAAGPHRKQKQAYMPMTVEIIASVQIAR